MRNKYLITIFAIIIFALLTILYLSSKGIKTKSFNGLIKERIKNINPNINLEINDVFLKLNFTDRSIELNTKNPILNFDKQKLNLSNVNVQFKIRDYFSDNEFIPSIKLSTKKISINSLIDFYNSYDFNLKRALILNQIKDGEIILNLNIDEDKINNKLRYQITGNLFDANINILNKYNFQKLNLIFKIVNDKIFLNDLNFNFQNNDFYSEKIDVSLRNSNYNVEGNLNSKRGKIFIKDIENLTRTNLNYIENDIIIADTINNFSFTINKNFKFKNFKLKSILNFNQIYLASKYRSLIYFKNGKVLTEFDGNDLNINIKSEYDFIKNQYKNKNSTDNIQLNIVKKKNKDFNIEGLIENKKNTINSSELKKYFKISKNLILEDQDLVISSKNKFSFQLNKKFNVNNLKIYSKMKIDEILLGFNSKRLNKYFPTLENKIKLLNNEFNIETNKNKFISISGNYLLNNVEDKYSLNINHNKKYSLFEVDLGLYGLEFNSKELDYKKIKNTKSEIKLNGRYSKNDGIKFNEIKYSENNNNFLINNLNISKNDKIESLDYVNFDYLNKKNKKNNFELSKKDKDYIIQGSSFDGSLLLNKLIKGDTNKSIFSIFNNLNSKININLKQVNIDQNSNLLDLKGELKIIKNKIDSGKIVAKLNGKKDFKLNIKTNSQNEKVTNIYIDEPEPFIKKYKFVKGFKEGNLSYDSITKNNISTSKLKIYDFKVKEVPILAKILTLASLQGIADILTGEGIRFDEFEMDYKTIKNKTDIEEMYAIGPAISIMMDGYIVKNEITSLRGTLVPATTINKSIAKIPLLGKILVGKKIGEGVFGVSFKIKGPPKNLKTSVNPIKTLTPRFITRTLEKLKN